MLHIIYVLKNNLLHQSVLLNTLICHPLVISSWRMCSKHGILLLATQPLCLCFYNLLCSTDYLLGTNRNSISVSLGKMTFAFSPFPNSLLFFFFFFFCLSFSQSASFGTFRNILANERIYCIKQA